MNSFLTDRSPTARTLLALELIQTTPGITAEQLASELGVTDRAARRYVGILREAGISIESSPGRFGGYRLGRGLKLPPLSFTAEEAVAIVMAALNGHHDLTRPGDSVAAAVAKVMRALPEPVAARAESLRRSATPAPDRSAARPDAAITTSLIEAVERSRAIRIAYCPESGSQAEFEVEPWAVVVRHGRWYLLCRSTRADAVRAYRVDRVTAVESTTRPFVPPPGLDAVRALEEHLASGWNYEADIIIEATVEELGQQVPRALGRLEPATHTTTRLRGSTSNPAWYVEQLACLRAPFRILGSDEIRAAASHLGVRLMEAADPQQVDAGPRPRPEV